MFIEEIIVSSKAIYWRELLAICLLGKLLFHPKHSGIRSLFYLILSGLSGLGNVENQGANNVVDIVPTSKNSPKRGCLLQKLLRLTRKHNAVR